MYQKSFFMKELKRRGVSKHPVTQRNLKHSKTSEIARLYTDILEKEQSNA